MSQSFKKLIVFLLLLTLLISACSSGESIEPDSQSIDQDEQDQAGDVVEDTGTADETVVEEASAALESQAVTFTASDGQTLEGTFFPAGSVDAPLLVLMHWAQGDQKDNTEIAYWLQNRGFGGSSGDSSKPWLDPSWFPELPEDTSYAVLTFTFRNCEGGCSSFERDGWLLDAQSAAEFAYNLEGIDSQRIIMVGASIGADGVADGCAHLNSIHPGSCRGAFSISPGNYLTLPYEMVVNESPAMPFWCLYAESDPESAPVCVDLEADNYSAYSYQPEEVMGNGHGMNLVEPNLDPNPLDLLIEFLTENLN